jgi:lipopolysaccharide heptosyltransferase II
MPRYLILRFSSIGDIVLTTPVIRCLKEQVPGCEIHFLTKKTFAGVLSGNPYIDKLITITKDVSEVMDELQTNNYDAVIDLHNNIRTFLLKRKLKRKAYTFQKLNIEKWLMVNLKVNKLPEKHIVHRYFEALSDLIKYDGNGLNYYISPENEMSSDQLPASHRNGYIAIVIGAKHATKMLPVDKVAELIVKLKRPVVLIGGKEDEMRAEEIVDKTGNGFSDYIYNGCGKYSLQQSASIVKQAKLVITNDTGLMHIAAAFNKNIISIWGNTIPAFGMTPFLPDASTAKNYISEVKNLNCRPCSKIGFNKCPKGHFKCMNEQDLEKIISQLANLEN